MFKGGEMKDEEINHLAESLFKAMFAYWQNHRTNSGFQFTHEQGLYDAVCKYRDGERAWQNEVAKKKI